MTGRATQLLDEVLKLSEAERAEIANALLSTLDEGDGASSAEVDAAWRAEARRRVERVLAGERGKPAAEAMSELRANLRS
jgi:hypothetical protein